MSGEVRCSIVLIPAYNEAAHLGQVLDGVRGA